MITPEEPLRLETVGVLRNGRRRYDPASKQRLVEACLQPGVSLAGLALQHGVNANLLRKWVAKRQLQNGDGQPEARAPIAPASHGEVCQCCAFFPYRQFSGEMGGCNFLRP